MKIFHERNRVGVPDSPAQQRCMAQGRDDLRREISLLRSLHDRNIVNFVGAAIWVRAGLPRRGVHRLAALPMYCVLCCWEARHGTAVREPVLCVLHHISPGLVRRLLWAHTSLGVFHLARSRKIQQALLNPCLGGDAQEGMAVLVTVRAQCDLLVHVLAPR